MKIERNLEEDKIKTIDMWNDLFENQTEKLTKQFLKQFDEKSKC
mgnify:CR=1 FL=1